jgi:hypothetical protein
MFWWIFPCSFMLLVAATIKIMVRFDADPHHGTLLVGAAIPYRQAFLSLMPLMLPLAAALACLAFARRRQIRNVIAGG